jgi:hypothetical protein
MGRRLGSDGVKRGLLVFWGWGGTPFVGVSVFSFLCSLYSIFEAYVWTLLNSHIASIAKVLEFGCGVGQGKSRIITAGWLYAWVDGQKSAWRWVQRGILGF